MKKIIFYNHFHNGDLHHSRNFVKYFIQNYQSDCEFYYAHENNSDILSEISNCQYKNIRELNVDHQAQITIIDDSTFINTWIGQKKFHYLNAGYGCSLITNLKLWSDIFSFFHLTIPSDEKIFLPSIDLQITIPNLPKKSILFCNNYPKSGQADTFDMANLITEYASANQDCICIISNPELINKKTLPNIIPVNEFCSNSLNHIGILSEKCDMIVGRTSGPFCFTLTRNNYFLPKIFVSFAYGDNNTAFWFNSPQHKYFLLKKENKKDLLTIKPE